MSSRLVSAPERVNSCFATSRMCSRLRCASARGFRLTDGERLLAISKSQKKTCNRRHYPVIYLFGGTLHFIKNWLTVGRKDTMTKSTKLGGTFKLVGTSTNLYRMGYGTMQLAGPEVWGPPRDVDAAVAVLREAIGSGVSHIDTSDFYGPPGTNHITKK